MRGAHNLPLGLACMVLAGGMLLQAPTQASSYQPPIPPCDGVTVPPYAPLGPAPEVELWHPEDAAGWQPPPCTGWTARPDARIVAAAGMIRGNDDEILARLGAISRQTQIRYWSAGKHDWKSLLEDASALGAPDAKARRPDFKAEEFKPGSQLFLAYDDAERVGTVVHELNVKERTPDRITVTTRNATPARTMGMTVAAPGDLEMAIFLDKAGPDLWRYYALSRFALQAPSMLQPSDLDFVNRAAAMYRFIAGEKTDLMPPVAPGAAKAPPAVGPVGARND